MGLLDSFMRGRVDLMNPQAANERRRRAALAEQRSYQEQQRLRGLEYAEGLMGTKGSQGQSMDPSAISPQEFGMLPPEMQGEYGTPSVAPAGFKGGLMDATEVINRERFNPYQASQTTGPNLAAMMGKGSPAPKYITMGVPGQPGWKTNAVVTPQGVNPVGDPWEQGAGVNINMGDQGFKVPAGMMRTEDGKSVRVIPGSKDDPYGEINVNRENREYAKENTMFGNVNDAIDELSGSINEYGSELTPGVGRDALETARANLMVQLKNYYELGALQKDDIKIMNEMIPDPTSVESYLKSTKEMKSSLKQLKGIIGKARDKLNDKFPHSTAGQKAAKQAEEDAARGEPEYEYRTLPSGVRQRRRIN